MRLSDFNFVAIFPVGEILPQSPSWGSAEDYTNYTSHIKKKIMCMTQQRVLRMKNPREMLACKEKGNVSMQ